MRQTFILIISVLAVMLTVSSSQQAVAQPEWGPLVFDDLDGMVEEDIVIGFDGPPMMEQRPQGEMPAPLSERLKLTDEQQTKLEELRIGVAKDMARLRADLQIARLDLMALLDQPSPKPEEARARATKVSDAQAAILQRMIAFQVAMKGLLTPDQQKLMQQERRMRMMGPGPPMGPMGRRFGRPFMRRGRPWEGSPQPEGRPAPER